MELYNEHSASQENQNNISRKQNKRKLQEALSGETKTFWGYVCIKGIL